MLVDQIRNKF